MELELTLDNFDAEIGKSTPILVDFWAAWCGPCRMLSGVIQQLANDSDGSYRVGKVNVDEQPELAKRFGIASIRRASAQDLRAINRIKQKTAPAFVFAAATLTSR